MAVMTDCWSANGKLGRKPIRTLTAEGRRKREKEERWAEEQRKANKATRPGPGGRRGDEEVGLIISFLPPSLVAVNPHSFLPVLLSNQLLFQIFLAISGITHQTGLRIQTHNKPASVTLNPTHKSLLKIDLLFLCLWAFLETALKKKKSFIDEGKLYKSYSRGSMKSIKNEGMFYFGSRIKWQVTAAPPWLWIT